MASQPAQCLRLQLVVDGQDAELPGPVEHVEEAYGDPVPVAAVQKGPRLAPDVVRRDEPRRSMGSEQLDRLAVVRVPRRDPGDEDRRVDEDHFGRAP